MDVKVLSFSGYQERATETRLASASGLSYSVLGLCSEAGEIASLLKKNIRDQGGDNMDPVFKAKMFAELGDILWYLAAIASDLGISLGEIAVGNVLKLEDRQKRNVIGGNGDSR